MEAIRVHTLGQTAPDVLRRPWAFPAGPEGFRLPRITRLMRLAVRQSLEGLSWPEDGRAVSRSSRMRDVSLCAGSLKLQLGRGAG